MSEQKASPMTSEAAARIQSTQAKAGKEMGSGGFMARAKAAATHNIQAAAHSVEVAAHSIQAAAKNVSESMSSGQDSGAGHQPLKSGK